MTLSHMCSRDTLIDAGGGIREQRACGVGRGGARMRAASRTHVASYMRPFHAETAAAAATGHSATPSCAPTTRAGHEETRGGGQPGRRARAASNRFPHCAPAQQALRARQPLPLWQQGTQLLLSRVCNLAAPRARTEAAIGPRFLGRLGRRARRLKPHSANPTATTLPARALATVALLADHNHMASRASSLAAFICQRRPQGTSVGAHPRRRARAASTSLPLPKCHSCTPRKCTTGPLR